MKIAYYAPLKSPWHPVPSGDRMMARLTIAALQAAGHAVDLVSEFRSFARMPADHGPMGGVAEAERARIEARWAREGRPDLWFTYHVYYKAPDLLGPALSRRAGLPYVTMEASWSERRNGEGWGEAQAAVLEAVTQAALNISMTARDEAGLQLGAPGARTARLKPFLDAADFLAIDPTPEAGRLVTVAMMRPGDKFQSYRALAGALARVKAPFTLDVVGDGPCRQEVEALFADFPPGRVTFHGALERPALLDRLKRAAIYVWPGVGEAYGMAYLEAEAAGLPVLAYRTGGVDEVVEEDRSGLLLPFGDEKGLARAVEALLGDEALRRRLASGARQMIASERGLDRAAAKLDGWLQAIARGETA